MTAVSRKGNTVDEKIERLYLALRSIREVDQLSRTG
jgi:hypothetical protein